MLHAAWKLDTIDCSFEVQSTSIIDCDVAELTWEADRLASDGHGLVDSWNEVSDAKNIGRHGEAATVNEDVLE